jgi:hypothetical protein
MGTCAGRNYLMKARGPTMPFYLPTGAVIERAQCRPRDIGLYATRPTTEGGALAFIPVRVAPQGQPDPSRSTLETALLPESDIRDASWRVVIEGRPLPAYQRIRSPTIIAAGEPLRFAIPVPPSDTFAMELRYTAMRDGLERLRSFSISTR